MKSYLPWNPEQSYLLPPSPRDWLPEGHLAYFILDVVKMLDLSAIIHAVDAKDARGQKPYSPVMMVALLLYAYCVGVFFIAPHRASNPRGRRLPRPHG
jgi:transposase